MNTVLSLFNRLLRWALWLVAGLLIFAALYVSVGRQFTPLVAEYREDIEQALQQRFQQDIQIEQLIGDWRGFSPVLEARYVTLGKGDSALQVETLQIQPNVLGSLLARELRLTAVTLDGLQIHIEQDQAGQWALQGVRIDTVEDAVFQLNDWLAKLQQLTKFNVLNSRVIIQAAGREPLALTYAGFTLSHIGQQHRLAVRAVLPDGETLELSAQGQLIDKDWRQSRLAVYLKTPGSNLAQWVPEVYLQGWLLDSLKLKGEVWLQAERGQVQQAVLRLAEFAVRGQAPHAEPLAVQSDVVLAFYQRQDSVHNAWFERLALQIDQLPEHDWRMLLSYTEQQATRWQLAVEQLELPHVHYLAKRLVVLPDIAEHVLASLQPTGRVKNMHLQWQPDAPFAERLVFASNLDNVEFSAWENVPAVSGINGHISGDLTQGELRLASADGFSLHLANLFAKPWDYHKAHAQLLWQFDEQGFTLQSPYLQVLGDEGELAGDFLIRLLQDPDAEDYMDLRVGLRDGDARFTGKYLPSPAAGFSAELEQWLSTAIQAGSIEQGYFQYQGSLNEGAAAEARSISLYFAVKDALLEYQPGWPALSEAAAEVLIEDSGVRIDLKQGKILNTAVSSAYAEVLHVAAGQVPVLQLQADLQSTVEDGLYFLQKTPIAQAALEFSKWQGQGYLPAALNLSVPLAAAQPVQVHLTLDAQSAELHMPEINVHLHKLNGQFVFDSQRGLSAKKISGEFLEQAFTGSIEARGTPAHLSSHIDVQGLMPIERLTRWAQVEQPIPASGILPYRLRVLLEGADSQLRIDSNLQGVQIDLPAPLGKAANEQSYADWRMTLTGAERRYWFDYVDQLSLSMAAPADNLLAARAQLRMGGGLAVLPTAQGLQVRGALNSFALTDWQQVLERYPLPKQKGEQQLLTSARLQLKNFTGLGLTVDDLSVVYQPQPTGWQLSLDSPQVKGTLRQLDGHQPLRVHFNRLHIPKGLVSETVEQGDRLADFDLQSIPELNIQIDQLYFDADSLGAWSLTTRPQAQGVLFDQLNLSLKGLNVTGQLGWERVNGQMRSWYKGRLAGENLKDVLSAWGFAPTITSETFRVDSMLRWAGSPAMLQVSGVSGDLDISLRNGQLVSVDGSSQALRVFGLLNFDSIGRRLRLDFSDLLDKGLAYDRVKGKLQVQQGVYRTQTPLLVEGPSSNLDLQGQVDSAAEQVDATLVVTLPLTNNLPLAAVAVGAPAVGGALFLVDRLLGDRISRFASVTYHISGDWQHPNISLFKKGNAKKAQ